MARKTVWNLTLSLLLCFTCLRLICAQDFQVTVPSDLVLSPDQKTFAYVEDRPADSKSLEKGYVRFSPIPIGLGGFRAEVLPLLSELWLASADGRDPRQLTDGSVDGAAFWAPRWSPGGSRLLMLSTRGYELQYWSWTSHSGLRKVLQPGTFPTPNCFEWLSDNEILMSGVATDPHELPPLIGNEKGGALSATNKEIQGPSVNVLEAGLAREMFPPVQIYRVNLDTGTQASVAAIASVSRASLSPDHTWLIFEKELGAAMFDPEQRLPSGGPDRKLATVLSRLDGTSVAMTLRGLPELTGKEIVGYHWSPDSQELIVDYQRRYRPFPKEFATAGEHKGNELFRCRLETGTCGLVPAKLRGESHSYLWFGGHRLLVRDIVRDVGESVDTGVWLEVGDGPTLRLFFDEKTGHVVSLAPLADGTGLVGIRDGAIWEFDLAGQPVKNLAPSVTQPVNRIDWDGNKSAGVENSLVFHVAGPSPGHDSFELEIKSGQIAPITVPTIETTALNRAKKQIRARTIAYRTLEGKAAGAWVVLPSDYVRGRRYPVIVSVYPGQVFEALDGEEQILTADEDPTSLGENGYVALTPSMPNFGGGVYDSAEEMNGKSRDMLKELTNGVVPAINKLVALGIADPERIGVIGHSFGGFAVYGLVTQTNCFKAAVAEAGFSDLVSFYLSLDGEYRYLPTAEEGIYAMDFLENPQGFWNPPWKDLGRYLRDSPITYVDRVQTPVMIVQGDMDFVPIGQGEEFFRALQRQNKRVEFVRYWGEGHVIRSPENIRDKNQRILAWFDEFLKPASSKPAGQ